TRPEHRARFVVVNGNHRDRGERAVGISRIYGTHLEDAALGSLAAKVTLPQPMYLSATQCLRLKHPLEAECGLGVGFLGLLLLSRSLVLRSHRVPIRHQISPRK